MPPCGTGLETDAKTFWQLTTLSAEVQSRCSRKFEKFALCTLIRDSTIAEILARSTATLNRRKDGIPTETVSSGDFSGVVLHGSIFVPIEGSEGPVADRGQFEAGRGGRAARFRSGRGCALAESAKAAHAQERDDGHCASRR